MIFSGSAVQTKGFGSSLVSRRKRLIAAWRSTMERNTPRLRRRLVSLAKKPSTALSHEAEVGVKCAEGKFQCGSKLDVRTKIHACNSHHRLGPQAGTARALGWNRTLTLLQEIRGVK